MLSMDKIYEYGEDLMDWAVKFTPKLILAIFVLIIGFWLSKKIIRLIQRPLQAAKISPEISGFLNSILDVALKLAVILMAAGIIGFQVSSLLGILAAIGFAVGLALQGFLGNFASGITIVFFKPYRVGDWVEVSEKFGRVESIQLFNTTIATPGNKTLIIPNGQVTDNTITNFSTKGYIRLELNVTMPYEESFPKVKRIILESLETCPKILKDPAPIVGIETYDSHSINLSVRPSIKPDDFWDVTFEAYQLIKQAYNNHGIQVAYSEGIELGKVGN